MNNRSQCVWFLLFVLYLAKGVSTCNLSDVECLTRASTWTYQALIPGIQGLVGPSDPLYKEEIVGELPTFKCHLFNVTMTGLTKCKVTQLKLNPEELKFDYSMRCPQLVINADGEVKGSLESVQIEGKGNINLVIDDYLIEFKGEYIKYIDEKDNKLHFVRKSYQIATEPMGGVKFEAENQSTGEKAESNQENSKVIEKLFRNPVLDTLFALFVENLSTFLRAFPLEDILLHGDKTA